MAATLWLLSAMLAAEAIGTCTCSPDNLAITIKLLGEQVSALLEHRQEDYNALEESLKRTIEKNTELTVLKNEVKQLRKEVIALRGGNGNEAKNERLRVRWLGSAVTELRGEVAEVLKARNASEELAERSRLRSELSLLKGDVAEVGRGVRNLGGRMTRIEAALGTIRVDIATIKERASLLSRTCADITSQLNAMQVEVAASKCESLAQGGLGTGAGQARTRKEIGRRAGTGTATTRSTLRTAERTLTAATSESTMTTTTTTTTTTTMTTTMTTAMATSRRMTGKHGEFLRPQGHRARLEERIKNLERRLSSTARRRGELGPRRFAYDNREYSSKRIKAMEKLQAGLSRRLSEVELRLPSAADPVESHSKSGGSVSLISLERKLEADRASTKRELAWLGVNAARKAAELSLTRDELANLRRAVQALSVSASKLQERNEEQRRAVETLNGTLRDLEVSSRDVPANRRMEEVEEVEDRYRAMVDGLPEECESRGDGLALLAASRGVPLLVSCHDRWIVVARRQNGLVDFDRTWADYSLGFGSPGSEFWIGNEQLHRFTRDNCTRLRIDLVDIYGVRWRAEYEHFNVDSVETGYRLRVSGYAGNATDALAYQNGMAFSAKDRDMDASATDCAGNYHGGWWFSHCQYANLNGKYSLGLTWFQETSNTWMAVAASEMAIRTKEGCVR